MAEEVTRSVIGQVVDHFDARRDAFTFIIPEWGDGDAPLTLVASPLTLRQRNSIEREMEERGTFAGYAACAVLALKHTDGAKAFDVADKPKLMRSADARVCSASATRCCGISLKWKPSRGTWTPPAQADVPCGGTAGEDDQRAERQHDDGRIAALVSAFSR